MSEDTESVTESTVAETNADGRESTTETETGESVEETAGEQVTADSQETTAANEKPTADSEKSSETHSLPSEDEEESPLVARVREQDENDDESDNALAPEVAALEARVRELERECTEREEEITDAEKKIADLMDRLQTKQADFQNYKQRAKKRENEIRARATEDLVSRLLDVRDNLGRALEDESDDIDSLREGVKLTRKEFDRVLDAEGVEKISPEPGEDVDATRHEVMVRVESEEPVGTVASVYRPGYEMGGKVLRTAQVTVSEEE